MARATADALHSAARALHDPELQRAADAYDRAARSAYGRIPPHTRSGAQLRATARLLALVGNISGDSTLAVAGLLDNLLDLAAAVTELALLDDSAADFPSRPSPTVGPSGRAGPSPKAGSGSVPAN